MAILEVERKFRALGHMVGNTPLLAIRFRFRGRARTIYAKAEHLNLSGSIKDRMALFILRRGYERGFLQPHAPIAEATSGNTGISFAAVGRALGHPVTIFMPAWMSQERKDLIRSLGAEIRLVSREEGGFLGSIRMTEEFAAVRQGAFLPRQFSNADNVAAHEQTTGPEIWWQLHLHGLRPDAFVAGVGSGGTVMGVGRFLRQAHPAVKLHPLEPASSPTLSTGHKVGTHRIQGISDEFIPSIMDLAFLDDVVSVDDGDAILMAQKLAVELGLGVGVSSGANFLGALKVEEQLGAGAVVVTVFPDDNKKYLSTDLLRVEPAKQGFLSPQVALEEFDAIKRVCGTCWDTEDCAANDERVGSDTRPDPVFCLNPQELS
ncbi:MAG: cysteine synthase family protein [Betaproteobacteria bacterium]|nr:cysteine synthase family protein [Betaproteobacteria bacterium]MBI2959280.1 cysteine synthase family protein [Betaproteobacteria bacterium]